ncbi:GDP-mannose 4,6-dehydratase [Patescibacteria group bacterium]|nr:GDP-mannose 4,6-dehydratase [Patescibacteria group bacterium]
MNILITGASGFVGTHFVRLYVKERKRVKLHCATYGGYGELARFIPEDQLYEIDLGDPERVKELVKKVAPTHIVHLAALAAVGESFTNPQKVLKNNILITANLFEAVRERARNTTVLLIGSADEYGLVEPSDVPINEEVPLRPTSPYAVSKVAVDYLGLQYFLSYKLKIIRLRPFNHIGEYQGVGFAVADFAKQIVEAERDRRKVVKVGNLTAIRDFTDVKDMVHAYELALEKCIPGEVYNIGSGKGIRMQDVLNMMLKKARREIRVEVDPKRYRPVDVESVIADASKFSKQTGWKPRIPLESTLERVLHYWRKKLRHEDGD